MSLAQRIRWTFRGLRHVAVRNQSSVPYIPAWLETVWSQSSPLQRRHPWMTYRAIQWLKGTLRPEMRVFEFGSGGSTLFFAERVAQVIAVEHDPIWYQQVQQTLSTSHLSNCQVQLVPQTPATEGPQDIYVGEKRVKTGGRFEAYAKSIDAYPDRHFDLVAVDGLARLACIQHAVSKIKPGGYLILDNAEWPEFQPAHDQFRDCLCENFYGLGPFGDRPWMTTVWQLPTDSAVRAAA
ncbi:hypothetical protein GC163_07265 [bacterium]|nr:hypothetical protein [bacterium]